MISSSIIPYSRFIFYEKLPSNDYGRRFRAARNRIYAWIPDEYSGMAEGVISPKVSDQTPSSARRTPPVQLSLFQSAGQQSHRELYDGQQ